MKCSRCGKEIGENEMFCRFCGAEQERKSNTGKSSKNSTSMLVVVLIGIVVVVLGGVACLLIGMNRDHKKNTATDAKADQQAESLTGNENVGGDVNDHMAENDEIEPTTASVSDQGADVRQLYEEYVTDVLTPKFGVAEKAPFVQMVRQSMEWSDYTEGLDEKNRGILATAYFDLSGDGIDEMIVLISERIKEPEYHPGAGGDYDTSYYEFFDAVSVYIYGIKDQQVEQLLTDSDIDTLRKYPLSNANDCTYKYMTITREGRNYLLMLGFTKYGYGNEGLEYILTGEENGQIRCLAGRYFNDGYIGDLISKEDVVTPMLPTAEDVPLDEEFYLIYKQPLADKGIELASQRSYFDGMYTSYCPSNLECTVEYPVFHDYPDDADLLMDLQCRHINDLLSDFEEINSAGNWYSFTGYVISEAPLSSDQMTSINWRNIVSEYMAANKTAVQLPDSEIENEVKRIRQVWTEDRGNISNQVFDKVEPQKGIRLYYQNGDLKMIETDKNVFDGYSRIFQIENGKLTFAYYESAAEQIRLYFYEESLFRWIQTNAGSDAVTHDNERGNSQFAAYEQMALNDVKKILN